MAVFTITLKDAIDYCADLDQKIGLDLYPIFDEAYRAPLNKKIVDHFMFREIGMESVEKFTFALRRKMNEIMPYYNQMLESERIKFDPLATFDMHTIVAGLNEALTSNNGTSNTLSDNAAKAISVQSDFPQTSIGETTTGNYATGSNESSSDGKATASATENSTGTSKSTDMNTQRVTGFSGSAADLLTRYRATLLNIDLAILSDLQELFMSVWDSGDTYFEHGAF